LPEGTRLVEVGFGVWVGTGDVVVAVVGIVKVEAVEEVDCAGVLAHPPAIARRTIKLTQTVEKK
jgi:hypothetical protein